MFPPQGLRSEIRRSSFFVSVKMKTPQNFASPSWNSAGSRTDFPTSEKLVTPQCLANRTQSSVCPRQPSTTPVYGRALNKFSLAALRCSGPPTAARTAILSERPIRVAACRRRGPPTCHSPLAGRLACPRCGKDNRAASPTRRSGRAKPRHLSEPSSGSAASS